MKIKYLGNFDNPYSDSTEKHIKYALEMRGHKVKTFDEKSFNMEDLVNYKADIFLFHKGGVDADSLINILSNITCKKVMWYFDKVWKERIGWMELVVPFVDYAFQTDETWTKRHTYKNVHVLRQGIGNEDTSLGTPKDKYKCDIAFLGSLYGERQKFADALTAVYGSKFKVFNNVFNRDLYDLCASAKIIVAPMFPQDDFYWSSRVYMTTGSGGFMIHPRFEALKEEFEDGKHIVTYKYGKELKEKIDYYLEHEDERKAIQKAGYEHCIENYTYFDRVKDLIEIVQS